MQDSKKTDFSVCVLAPWFGPWPVWINFFLESCRWNTDVTWILPTDQEEPECRPYNCIFKRISFSDYIGKISATTGVSLANVNPYKICDFKPCLGDVHASDLREYSHFGYCDLDIIFGNIRTIYHDEMLRKYDVISSHAGRLAGHLSIFRNTARMRRLYRDVPFWQDHFTNPNHTGFDEGAFGGYVWKTRFRGRLKVRVKSSLRHIEG